MRWPCGCSEEEAEAESELINRLCRNPDTSKEADPAIEKLRQEAARDTVYRPGDGELNFTPLLSVEEEKIASEGFESVLAGSGSQQATRAPQAQQK